MLWDAIKSYSNRKRTQGKTEQKKEKEINESNNNKCRILKARKRNNENIIILIIFSRSRDINNNGVAIYGLAKGLFCQNNFQSENRLDFHSLSSFN